MTQHGLRAERVADAERHQRLNLDAQPLADNVQLVGEVAAAVHGVAALENDGAERKRDGGREGRVLVVAPAAQERHVPDPLAVREQRHLGAQHRRHFLQQVVKEALPDRRLAVVEKRLQLATQLGRQVEFAVELVQVVHPLPKVHERPVAVAQDAAHAADDVRVGRAADDHANDGEHALKLRPRQHIASADGRDGHDAPVQTCDINSTGLLADEVRCHQPTVLAHERPNPPRAGSPVADNGRPQHKLDEAHSAVRHGQRRLPPRVQPRGAQHAQQLEEASQPQHAHDVQRAGGAVFQQHANDLKRQHRHEVDPEPPAQVLARDLATPHHEAPLGVEVTQEALHHHVEHKDNVDDAVDPKQQTVVIVEEDDVEGHHDRHVQEAYHQQAVPHDKALSVWVDRRARHVRVVLDIVHQLLARHKPRGKNLPTLPTCLRVQQRAVTVARAAIGDGVSAGAHDDTLTLHA
mmetsp:Transcript_16234/g.56703  ORF Transcript_16234/g.56703 Transcript_16234/m.56703 type:complete len:464 (-) Transcript_16234:488-1879(-)